MTARTRPPSSRSGLTSSCTPRSITVGPDGALWFVENGGSGRLGRITTAGELTCSTSAAFPTALAAGPLGSLWFSRGATVFRLSDLAPFSTGAATTALAAGPDGALWGAMTGAVARIGPAAR